MSSQPPAFPGGGGSSGGFLGGSGSTRLTRSGWFNKSLHRVETGYKVGDEWAPANNPESITSIQRALIAAGYADKLQAGVWNSKSASAYKKALTDANKNGVTVDEMLSRSMEGQAATDAGALGGGEAKQGKTIERPNLVTGGGTFKVPAAVDVSVAMRNTFNDLLAMDPSQAEELTFQQTIRDRNIWEQAVAQGQEDQMKKVGFMQDMATIDEKVAGQGALEAGQDITVGGRQDHVPNAVVEQAPSPQALAEYIARTKYPEKYGAVATNKRLGDILTALQQQPNQRPLAR